MICGRILTEVDQRSEVCTHGRGQDSPIQTDLPRLIRCSLYGKNKNNSVRVCNWFVPIATDILLPNGDEPNFISSSKFCSSSLLLFSHQLFATYRNKYC